MNVKQGVSQEELQTTLTEAAERHGVPGVAVGVYHQGEEHYAFHGVTSTENPLPVDENTLFQFGSTGKTYTATAMLRLVERGDVDLNEKVKKYVPELKLKDKNAEENVTVLQLFNHTAGWEGDFMKNTGDGDDCLQKFVEAMAGIEQVSPLGSEVSYNNASLSLAGYLISKVTDKTYEEAIKELLFEPIGLDNTYFFNNEIMTRRFVCGHNQTPDGEIKIARPWGLARSGSPAGGMSATAEDQIKWAKFHLGDGTGKDGTQVLSKETIDLMKQPTVDMRGSAIGDFVGISWLIDDKEGLRLVGHCGTTNGQLSSFVMVPERDFAVIVLTNCAPNGAQLYQEIERWAIATYLGVEIKDPEPIDLNPDQIQQYTGKYETIAVWVTLTDEGGKLMAKLDIKPEFLKQLREEGEDEPDDEPPLPIGILPGEGDRYIISGGRAKGMTGYFVRGESGDIEAVHMGGRLATRISDRAAAK